MAWWPFGKKKPEGGGDEADPSAPATPEGAADLAPTVPPQPNLDAPAPTILVPPEFAPGGGAEAPTLAPQQIMPGGDPFGAASGDPFGAPGGDPFGGDPFAAPGAPQDFSRTLEDPESPKVAAKKGAPARPAPARPAPAPAAQGWGAAPADPFAAPAGRQDFAQTLGDPEEDVDRTLAPSYALGANVAAARGSSGSGPPAPAAARGQPAPPGAADLFTSAEPTEKTMKMPGPPVRGGARPAPAPAAPSFPQAADEGLTFTAPASAVHNVPPAPSARPVPAAAPASAWGASASGSGAPAPVAPVEETPMLAKTAALSPEKRKLGRALLAGGAITQEKLQEELDKAGKSQSVLGKALLKANFPSEDDLLAALVAQIRIPKINVRNTKIPLETIRVVPADVARRYKVLPIERIGDILVIVSPGVGDEEALATVRKATGCAVFPFQCDAEGFDEVVGGYYDRLAASGLAPAPSPTADSHAAPAPGPTPRPITAAASGALAAIPADDGMDEWDRIFAAAGPLPAEEVLL